MKSTVEKLISNGTELLGWACAGGIASLCLFYVADFALQRLTNIDLYHRGELLMDVIHKPTDSLVLGYLLFFWLIAIGALLGFMFGVFRVARQK